MNARDRVVTDARIGVGVDLAVSDPARARTLWRVDRWDADDTADLTRLLDRAPGPADFGRHQIRPYAISVVAGNLLTTAGLTRLTSLLIAGGGQALTNTSARIGVGNGSGSAAVGDTDLSAAAGSGNRWFQVMDATYPLVAAGVVTFRSTFGTADGNFAWNEFGVDIGTPTVTSAATVNANLFNHKTSIAQGTKASGQTWTATATITFS